MTDELRAHVLHREQALGKRSAALGVTEAVGHDGLRRPGRGRERCLGILGAQTRQERVAIDAQALHAQGQGRGLVQGRGSLGQAGLADVGGQAVDNPARQRARDLDVRAQIGHGRQRRLALAGQATQHAVGKAGQPLSAQATHRAHGAAHGRVRGDAVEEQELVRGHTQDCEHGQVELAQAARGHGREGAIEAELVAQHAVDELGGQAALAHVEAGAGQGRAQRQGRKGILAGHATQHALRERAAAVRNRRTTSTTASIVRRSVAATALTGRPRGSRVCHAAPWPSAGSRPAVSCARWQRRALPCAARPRLAPRRWPARPGRRRRGDRAG